jgi:hypothetical protein
MSRRFLVCSLALLLALAGLSAGAAAPAGPHRVALPLVAAGAPRGALGVEISWSRPDAGLRGLGPGWVRRNGLSWAAVEPVAGGSYRWDAPSVRALESQLEAAASLGLRVILVVQGSPYWAVAPYRASCAPINRQHYDAFARFVAAAVRRYSAPPFNVRYWELGNEPDAFVFEADSVFGCWGLRDEPLYGGQAYGELLKAAYPAIKAADPRAQVLSGGLLLGQPYDPSAGQGNSARFLEGMLEAGAGDSFDILAFHSYRVFDGTADGGPAQDWKPAYLRAILARYGLSKPLLNSEGALLCNAPSAGCAEAQAHALARLYVRSLRDELLGFVWYLYDSDGFRNTALVEPADPSRRRMAFWAFAQATAALDGLSYIGPVAGLPAAAEGHLLAGRGRWTIVLWANTPDAVRLDLGQGVAPTCAEWDGTPLPCAADATGALAMEAVPGPRYITWRVP